MPVFNGARTLRQSVTSVLDQTFRSLELVVVDDASTDDTVRIAEELAKGDARVRIVRRERSGGPAAARNSRLVGGPGRFRAFCDVDGLGVPGKLERQLDLARSSGASRLYCGYHRVSADFAGTGAGFVPAGRVVYVPTELSRERLLRRNVIGN